MDLSALPGPVRQELGWCVFRIIADGGKVDVTHMRALVRRLCEVISDLGPAAPSSLTRLAPPEWQPQVPLAGRRRTRAPPSPRPRRHLPPPPRRPPPPPAPPPSPAPRRPGRAP